MATVEANGIHIYYESAGTGHPLLLIPGISYSHWMWHKMVPGLADHFRVIAMDNRGAGQSDSPPGPYSAALLADDAAALLRALDAQPAAVLGHSMGGFVAQALALDHPDAVSHLLLSATNFGGPNHIPITAEAMAVLGDVSGDPLARFKRGLAVSTAPGFAATHPDVIAEWVAYRLGEPIDPGAYQAQLAVGLGLLAAENAFEQRLPAVAAPALILAGAEDRVVPPGNAALLAARLAASTVHIFPDAGHFYPLEIPEEAVGVIVDWLQAH